MAIRWQLCSSPHKATLGYTEDKHSNIVNALASDMDPPVCAPSLSIDFPPESGRWARRPSDPP
eukprot:2022599-Pyramimonas_sp.AAC.1